MHRAALTLLLAIASCATATVRAPRTTAAVTGTAGALGAPTSRNVVIVSRSGLRQAADDLAFAATGVEDDAGATLALERALTEHGWQPASDVQFAAVVTAHQTAVALRELQARPSATLSDAALIVGAASTADRVVVVRGWRPTWWPTGAAHDGWLLCTLSADLEVVVYDRRGNVAWQGISTARASDLTELAMTVEHGRATVSDQALAIAAHDCAAAASPASPDALDALAASAAHEIAAAFAPPP